MISVRHGNRDADTASTACLTRRKQQILALLALGCTNRQMAAHLGISEGTVHCHMHHILRKLGVTSRTQAALWAVHAVRSADE